MLVLNEQLASRLCASANQHYIVFMHFGIAIDFLLRQSQHSLPNISEDVILALGFFNLNMTWLHHFRKRIYILVLFHTVVLHDGPSVQQLGL